MAFRGLAVDAAAAGAWRKARTHWQGGLYSLVAAGLLALICLLCLGSIPPPYVVLLLLAGLLSQVVLGRYDLRADWGWTQPIGLGRRLATSWFGILTVLLLIGFATGTLEQYSRVVTLSWALTYPLVMLALHQALRRGFGRSATRRRAVALLGAEEPPWVRVLAHSRQFQLEGVFGEEPRRPVPGVACLGGLADVSTYLLRSPVEAVFVTLPPPSEAELARVLEAAHSSGASVYLIPASGAAEPVVGELERVEGLLMIRLTQAPQPSVPGLSVANPSITGSG